MREVVSLFVLSVLWVHEAQFAPQDSFDFDIDFDSLGCAPGFDYSDTLARCVIQCPEEQEYVEEINSCANKCRGGTVYNRETKKCDSQECPEGTEFLSTTGKCVPVQLKCEDEAVIESIISSDDLDIRQVGDNCREKTCEDYYDLGFRCAPHYICSNSTIITDGKKLLDIRTVDGETPSDNTCCQERRGVIDLGSLKCPKRGYVCCKHPDYSAKPCGVLSNCPIDPVESKNYEECGRIITDTDFKFIDGSSTSGKVSNDLAQPGEFPHMCLIYRKQSGQNVFIAGAAMIDRNKFVTTAHKFKLKNLNILSSKDFYIRCGETNVKLDDEILDHQESKVDQIFLHPDYDESFLKNNLAILVSKQNFIYQKHIGRVCLPNPGEQFEGLRDCYSTGWGTAEYESNVYSDQLRKVQLSIIDRDNCTRVINNLERVKSRNKKFVLFDSVICVGGDHDGDTCKGDGGSPHVCNINNKWVQVGAVFGGFGCGGRIPALYSSISTGMCWIDWVMTCMPLARENVNFSVAEVADIRQSSSPIFSVNDLKKSDCQNWLDDHPDLKSECAVQYS